VTGPLFTPTPAELVAMRALLVDLFDIVAKLSPGAFGNRAGYEKLIELLPRVELLRLQQQIEGTAGSGTGGLPQSQYLHTHTGTHPGSNRAGQ
jgi:hypothetical protein